MNKLFAIIALIIAAMLTSCAAKPAPVTTMPKEELTEEYYGKAYGVMLGEDEFKKGKYDLALSALNEGLWFLRKANTFEKCGTSRTLCLIYKAYGLYLRAIVHAMNDDADKAVADLMWIHDNDLMPILAKSYPFWKEPRLNSLKDNKGYQLLVRTYQR